MKTLSSLRRGARRIAKLKRLMRSFHKVQRIWTEKMKLGLTGENVHTAGMLKTIPKGYRLLVPVETVLAGDFWYRPCDGIWVETGVAHWGHRIKNTTEGYARKDISRMGPDV